MGEMSFKRGAAEKRGAQNYVMKVLRESSALSVFHADLRRISSYLILYSFALFARTSD